MLVNYPLDEEGLTYKKLVEATYPDLEINPIHHTGVVDGAAAVVLASPEYTKAYWAYGRSLITE